MSFTQYFIQSVTIFAVCFFFGTHIDSLFRKWTRQKIASPLILALSQLTTVICFSYLLHHYHSNLETYTPHVLFSTFLLSLQTTMIANFNDVLGSSSR